ncbi:MAG TPA: TolC family protein [Pirellulales bacterium]|jgi:outer membrane protein TolC|nr:TolC family protein [Pirellulales bacterium]
MAAQALRIRRVWAPWAAVGLLSIGILAAGCRSQPGNKTPPGLRVSAAAAAGGTAPAFVPPPAAGPQALVVTEPNTVSAASDIQPIQPASYQPAVTPPPPVDEMPVGNVPLEEAPLELTLDQAVTYGLDHNPRLREATAQVSAARATADIAFAPFLPTVGTSFRYSAFNVPVLPGGSFVPASLSSGVTSFALAEAGIQWTVYDFGRTAGRYGQAVDRARSEELSMVRRQQTVAFEVAQCYFRLLAAQSNLRVQDEALRQADSILADSRARFIGGVVQRETVLRAEVEVSRVRQDLISARQSVNDSLSTLNVALGRSAQMPLAIVDVAAEPAPPTSLPACLEQAVVNRREIGMARQTVAEAWSGRQAAKGEFLPNIYVRGTVLRVDSPGPLNAWVEGAGIHVDQPIYAGGAHQGELRRNDARIAAARAGLEVVLDQVSLQVSVSYQAIATDLERILVGEIATAQAAENLRLTLVNYQNGNATPTDVVDAQTALTQAQVSYSTAIYSYLAGLSQLEYSLGNGQETLIARLRQPPAGEMVRRPNPFMAR